MVRTTQEHNQPSNELFIILYIYICVCVCVYIIRTLVYYVISNSCNSYAYSSNNYAYSSGTLE